MKEIKFIIGILYFILVSQQMNIIHTINYEDVLVPEVIFTVDEYTILIQEENKGEIYKITAYDLSASTHGITKYGVDLNGQSWDSAKVVAVDPRVIPLGSQVQINFIEEEYKQFSGIYNCVDTGSAIKGKIIDFFIGDNATTKEAIDFGITKAYVEILE